MSAQVWVKKFAIHKHEFGVILSCAKHSLNRQANIMNKFLAQSDKRFKRNPIAEHKPGILPAIKDISKGSKNYRRLTVLNNLYMEEITNIMATGRNSGHFNECDIQVTRVSVSNQYDLVKIGYMRSTSPDESVIKTLESLAVALRQDLCNIKVLGRVPKLKFVLDKTYVKNDVEKIFTSPEYINEMKRAEGVIQGQESEEKSKPVMRLDVFNLDHSAIMQTIVTAKKKSKALHRSTQSESLPKVEERTPVKLLTFDKKALDKFLAQRKQAKLSSSVLMQPRTYQYPVDAYDEDEDEDEDEEYSDSDDLESQEFADFEEQK